MAKNMEISLLFDFYGDMLTEKQRDVVELYYNDDLSLSEIAENFGITRQGVRDIIKRAEQRLNLLEAECRYCERFSKLKKLSAAAKAGDRGAEKRIFEIIDDL